jgi:hypothetical protein
LLEIVNNEFIKKPCSKNPDLMDLYVIGELGWEKLMFCSSTGVWEED